MSDTGLVYEHFLVGGNNVGVEYHFNQSAVEINKTNKNGNWEILSYNSERNDIDRFECGLIINAAGQWSDDISVKAGIKPINLVTHKRSVIVFTYKDKNIKNDKQQISDLSTPWLGWISTDNEEIFHSCFQNNNGIFLYDKLLNDGKDNQESHANHDEMQIVLEKVSKYTNLKIEKIASKSAGIKCSIEQDANMVIGCDPNDNSFVWLSALNGYGIQTSPAYSELTSYLATGKQVPPKFVDIGINVENLSPSRLVDGSSKASLKK